VSKDPKDCILTDDVNVFSKLGYSRTKIYGVNIN